MIKSVLDDVLWCLLACILVFKPLSAAETAVLLENVYLFDGKSDRRTRAPINVLVSDHLIESISLAPIAVPADTAVQILDGNGATLMPGLIDAHWHAMMVAPTKVDALTADIGYLHILAARAAEATLMRGFTSVRDVGGPVFGLRRSIEQGLVAGPRIFPSGAMISQTGGHFDFRLRGEIPRDSSAPLSYTERMGFTAIADGVDEVLRRSREQLMLGATQIKLAAGGGVSSAFDPLDVTQYTPEELHAAVSAAENWGTYVMVHAYTSRAVQMAVEAGVKSIEHGQLVDEDTARLMAKKGVWWSLQPFLDNELANPKTGELREKQKQVAIGTDSAFKLAKKYKIKVAFGTDVLFRGNMGDEQNAILVSMQRWYSPGEVLKMATGDNAQLLAQSGARYPYSAPLGVIEEGALADLLLIDGDPTQNLALLKDPEKNLLLIMKNGRIYKNLLDSTSRQGNGPMRAPSVSSDQTRNHR